MQFKQVEKHYKKHGTANLINSNDISTSKFTESNLGHFLYQDSSKLQNNAAENGKTISQLAYDMDIEKTDEESDLGSEYDISDDSCTHDDHKNSIIAQFISVERKEKNKYTPAQALVFMVKLYKAVVCINSIDTYVHEIDAEFDFY